jgi:hypothetical protein
MLKFTILSDAQSELMQGGSYCPRNGYKPSKPKHCWSNGHGRSNGISRTTTKTLTINGSQVGNSAAVVLGGHGSTALSEVNQTMTITATA